MSVPATSARQMPAPSAREAPARLAYLDAIGGIAGDMVLGALLDAGAPPEPLEAIVEELGLPPVAVERVRRGAVVATWVRVRGPSGPVLGADELRARLEGLAGLLGPALAPALDAFDRLVAAEAAAHGVSADRVVFHELGGLDTVVDLAGAFSLLGALGVRTIVCSPLPYGRALVATDHGALPAPTPAVFALLPDVRIVGVPVAAELVTPTGAAILAASGARFGDPPAMRVARVGHGAGSTDLAERPNVLRIVVGEAVGEVEEAVGAEDPALREVVVLEANLDDLAPELVPDAVEACVGAGALDVWTVPVQMKKGRPGIVVSAVARPGSERAVALALLEHTSTLGVRATTWRRWELDRREVEVRVEGRPIRVKLGVLGGRVVNVAPEHDDCAAVARGLGWPTKRVWAAALAAAATLPEAAGAR